MSMAHAIQHLAQAMRQAAADHNWPALLHIDAEIALLLTELKGKHLDEQARQAMALLQKIHAQTRDYCQGQSDMLAIKMAVSMRNREGATAYAAFMDEGETK